MEEFTKLVSKMRKAQIDYFRYKGSNYLRKSITLEKQVDEAIRSMQLAPEASYSQKGLFQDHITEF